MAAVTVSSLFFYLVRSFPLLPLSPMQQKRDTRLIFLGGKGFSPFFADESPPLIFMHGLNSPSALFLHFMDHTAEPLCVQKTSL